MEVSDSAGKLFPATGVGFSLIGYSLRGIIKYLKHIPDEEIVGLNLPTAVPYVFEFDNDLNLKKDYFLGDPEKIKKLMEAVARLGKMMHFQ